MTEAAGQARPVAIVTGGGRGIGAATARVLAEDGYDLVLTYVARSADVETVAEQCRSYGVEVCVVRVDTGVREDVDALYSLVDSLPGRLAVVVNNAGILPDASPVAEMEVGRVEHVLAVNSVGAFHVARDAVRRMSRSAGGHGGVVVNVSSRAAVLGSAGEFVDYAMSKAALDALTIGLAQEVGRDGVRVVGVRPGLIDTDMNAAHPGRLERMVGGVPLGRTGTAEEVASAIRWLVSDAAGYLTGTTIDVSGGR